MPSPLPHGSPLPRPRTHRRRRLVAFLALTAAALAVGGAHREHRTPFEQVGIAEHPWIRECSGVIPSHKYPGVFWVHNDSGNEPLIFALAADGKNRGVFRVAAENKDWEDIKIDAQGRIYLSDTGNNEHERQQVQVYRIAEPDLPADAAPRDSKPAPVRLRPDKEWRLKFPGEPFDGEAFFLTGTHGYLISKEHKKRNARLFRFDIDTRDADAKERLEEVAELPILDPVTSADLSPDGKRLAVLSDGGLFVFPVKDGDVLSAVKGEPQIIDTPRDNCEGVCFTPDGIVITSEKGRIFRMVEHEAK